MPKAEKVQESKMAVNPHHKPDDYYMLPGDSTRYTLAEMMLMKLNCRNGITDRFAQDPNSNTLADGLTGRRVYARTDRQSEVDETKPHKVKVVSKGGAAMARAMASQGHVLHSLGDVYPQQ